MEAKNKIAAAFVKAKKEFGPALKEKVNGGFKSKYADLGACLEAVDEALLNNGIALYQETFLDETGVTVETVFLHESGETLRAGKLHVPAAKQDPQGYGSALTYVRRYSLMAACGIAPEDDDGNAASKPSVRAPTPPAVDIKPWLAKMDAATSGPELKEIAIAAWEATSDDRIVDHQKKLVAARKKAASDAQNSLVGQA